MHINRKYIVFLSIFMLLALAGLGVLWSIGRAQPDATTLSIDPTPAEVAVGNQVTVDMVVTEAVDLYGASIALTFDPTIVQVDGTSITPGTCPQADFVVQNTVDNVAGTISYDVTSLAPTTPCNGTGVIASITFNKIATGTSSVHFNTWLLADTNGVEIPTSTTDGEITDPTGPPALLWLDPQFPEISIGASDLIDLRLDNISNVYGAEVSLSYDDTILEVVGGAVTPGTCPAPDFVATNTAGGGSVDYAVTQLNPTPPCNGGVVASIEFQCLPATPPDTLTNVTIAHSLISDPDGTSIPHNVQNATVLCVETGFIVEGSVSLQGWPTSEPPDWPAGWPLG
ncbi:MAG: cohesin domain-containing protein, partial [Anaerolineales bacterium]